MTMAERILARCSGRQKTRAGEIVTAAVDCAMMDDILGPRVLHQNLEELGGDMADKDKVVVVCDHYTPSGTISQANIVAFTRQWCREKGIANYFEGVGPCHQILAEYGFSLPGTLLVGTDSHTCTSGAFGCFGTGIGSTEMAGVLATGEIWLRVPETIQVLFHGKLQDGVHAKDLILKVIGELGHGGATYMALEFGGGTIEELSMDERMCISNMAVEAGAKAGLIPPDDKTEAYIRETGTLRHFYPLLADTDAKYHSRLEFHASKISPQVACPHSVDNVWPIEEVAGTVMERAYLGSCTGGRLEDLKVAASIVKGNKLSRDCKLYVSPASQKIWIKASNAGYLETLAKAGAVILAPTCGACVGANSGLIGEGEHCVSSSNRNFKGRMGSKDSFVYLASPATVAASALEGRLADPRNYSFKQEE